MHPRRSERCCGSSPSGMPASSNRCCASIWWRCARGVDLLPGADARVFIDIDSLLRPVYGHAKQGASYGHTKIAGKQILRKGLSPLATTISTPSARAGDRRDAAARRARPAPARARRGWSPKRSAPPAPPAPPARSWCAATRPTATARWCGACRAPRRPVLAGDDPQPGDRPGDRRDRRGRVDPGALSRRGARSRHRGLDL